MHRAVSVSLGSSVRDKEVSIRLLDKDIHLERHGTDGDEKRARAMFEELDGKVDALGVGGVELGICLPWRDYPLRSGVNLVQGLSKTPFTDGHHLKSVLESRVMPFVEKHLEGKIRNKKAFLVEAISRWGMTQSFLEAGYECVFGDLMFGLGIPMAIHTIGGLERAARLLLPIVGKMPISMLYSTGDAQKVNSPKYEKFYKEASIIAGDWLYIRKHIPLDMEGKIIITNTTTEEDVVFMKNRGIRYLITTTPVYDGRSFGTNAFEAACIVAAGKGRVLENDELAALIDEAGIEPTIRDLSQS